MQEKPKKIELLIRGAHSEEKRFTIQFLRVVANWFAQMPDERVREEVTKFILEVQLDNAIAYKWTDPKTSALVRQVCERSDAMASWIFNIASAYVYELGSENYDLLCRELAYAVCTGCGYSNNMSLSGKMLLSGTPNPPRQKGLWLRSWKNWLKGLFSENSDDALLMTLPYFPLASPISRVSDALFNNPALVCLVMIKVTMPIVQGQP